MKLGPFSIGEEHVLAEPSNGNGEKPRGEDFRELGATGQTNYGSIILQEYNPALVGPRGLETYDQMRKGDGQVHATLTLLKAPLLSAQWYMEPYDDSPEAREQADLAWWALTHMSKPWSTVLNEALSFLDFGFYLYEKVFEYTEWQGRTVAKWKKWGPRHPRTITKWEYDENGGLNGAYHMRSGITGSGGEIFIPIRKLLLFNLNEEAGNPEGISILRSAYKHWYFKDNLYKVDAIQKERHGIGIPIVELPPNYTKKDKDLANEMAKNLRTNEQAHVVKPPGFVIGFLEFRGGQNPVDPLKSAMHHDLMIARNILAQFLNIGADTSGTAGSSTSMQELFVKNLKYIADEVRGVINQFAIPELINYNFMGVENYPELKVRRIGENADWRALSVALRNQIEVGALTPDTELEEFLRDQQDLPKGTSEALERDVETRTAKKSGDYSNRVPLPSDGGEAQP